VYFVALCCVSLLVCALFLDLIDCDGFLVLFVFFPICMKSGSHTRSSCVGWQCWNTIIVDLMVTKLLSRLVSFIPPFILFVLVLVVVFLLWLVCVPFVCQREKAREKP